MERRKSLEMFFDPPQDAEPDANGGAAAEGGDADKPRHGSIPVLGKLQKWADYPAVGEPVPPTLFLPMKTPMSCEILSSWSLPDPPRHPLTVPSLLQSQAAAGRDLGLIIDLANHECLYADDVPAGVEYAHVGLVAKVLPPREAIDAVAAAADAFWARCPARFVGIHCAYGFNRTGFVVVSYLCQYRGMSVPEALESFARARPPGVKHGKFVEELYERYGGSGAAGENDKEAGSESAGVLGDAIAAMAASEAGPRPWRGDGGDGGAATSPPCGSPGARSTRSTPVSISRQRSLAGGSARSLLREQPAPADGGEGAAGEAAPVQDFTAMARHLDRDSSMRRETSLGLAKALHEDFGVHDSTPQRNSPVFSRLPAAAAQGGADARSCDDGAGESSDGGSDCPDGGCRVQRGAPAAQRPAGASPAAGAPRPPPRLGGGPLPSPPSAAAALYMQGSRFSTDRLAAAMPRNVSMDSDNQSLGFGAREVLVHLRGATPSVVAAQQEGLPRADTRAQLSELDPEHWEGAGSPTPGSQEPAQRGRPPGGGCRMS